jgi:hypothetical protein
MKRVGTAFALGLTVLVTAVGLGTKWLSDGQARSADTALAKSVGLSCLIYANDHEGRFPRRLDIPEIKQTFQGPATNYLDREVWPLMRYWPPDSLRTSNDFFLAWPTRDGWICLRTNFDAQFRRDLPESANQTVQRTGASRSDRETNRTSAAAGSGR